MCLSLRYIRSSEQPHTLCFSTPAPSLPHPVSRDTALLHPTPQGCSNSTFPPRPSLLWTLLTDPSNHTAHQSLSFPPVLLFCNSFSKPLFTSALMGQTFSIQGISFPSLPDRAQDTPFLMNSHKLNSTNQCVTE